MRSLIVIIPLAAAFLGGCEQLPSDPALLAKDRRAAVEARVCAAMQVAIAKDVGPAANEAAANWLSPYWGKCDLTSDDGRKYSVAHSIKIPHTDEHGTWKPDTFYMGEVKIDPATGEARASDLVHN